MTDANAEVNRLQAIAARTARWRLWGPYLAERQWGTVREDYSADGDAWNYFPHDHARSRAYRWGEDGLLGISDSDALLCFAPALWNGADPILKERLFGLTGHEGNHGEDVKEYYFYLDSTPTHAYMKALYKYPQHAFPYQQLIEENGRRDRTQPEYELIDTGIFAEDRYFDLFVEYGKAAPDDLLIRLTAANRGPDPAVLHLLPTLWFRNTWSWGREPGRPSLSAVADAPAGTRLLRAEHARLGTYWLACQGAPELLFTENETNTERLFNTPNPTPYVKDAFHEVVVHGRHAAVNPAQTGSKAAAHYVLTLPPGGEAVVRLRLSTLRHVEPFAEFDLVMQERLEEADAFYSAYHRPANSSDARRVQRQAFAGLLWSKQHYAYDVNDWLQGDPAEPKPPPNRANGRNSAWSHLNNADILSMPDTWEYPWFAAWDLAFHCVVLALVDPRFAKTQLVRLTREWYMHPNGQLPAYEWNFSDVNPPVHAWAAYRVYRIDQRISGQADPAFLERVFHKLLMNFTWWVNRKDPSGRNVFEGGFLGLDNIGVFDRSAMLPNGGLLAQADATSWMGVFSLNMMTIALELSKFNPAYEDVASKFFDHFLGIARAMSDIGSAGINLWDDEDEFFYDVLAVPGQEPRSLRVRSAVGLIPLLAVETLEPATLAALPAFRDRLEWTLQHRPELASLVSRWQAPGLGERRLLAFTRGHRLKCLLRRMLDPNEFLSEFGIRALSKYHEAHPYSATLNGQTYTVDYEPAESTTGLFGGNSNWRGPIWMPLNYLLIESLQRFYHYFGDDFLVECPTGSGQMLTLWQVASEISRRVGRLFIRHDASERRPVFGANELFQNDPNWRDYVPFYEYFNGDTGAGLGASHQTGWTALVAKLIEQQGRDMAGEL
jgi:hypothetical protein